MHTLFKISCARPAIQGLSPAEATVLKQRAKGKSPKEIADTLCRSVHTVRTNLNRAVAKLGAKDLANAIYIAVNNGQID